MATWSTRGLRGSTLEDMINLTNEQYRDAGLALIQKVPTPITPLEIDRSRGLITKAYFERKSTVDYIGVVQGIPVCFDAKECATMTFSLANLHEHQYDFMRRFDAQEGLAFLLIYFRCVDEVVYVPFSCIRHYVQRARNGGRKSFLYKELDLNYTVRERSTFMVHYLEMINRDLGGRNE